MVEVPLTYHVFAETEQYDLQLKTEASIDYLGCKVVYTETGTIPFVLQPRPKPSEPSRIADIRCQGNPDPKFCYGTSRYTITSKGCPYGASVTGEGTLSWTLSGNTFYDPKDPNYPYLNAMLTLTDRDGSVTACARGICNTSGDIPIGLAALAIINLGGKPNPIIPIEYPFCVKNDLSPSGVEGFIQWCAYRRG